MSQAHEVAISFAGPEPHPALLDQLVELGPRFGVVTVRPARDGWGVRLTVKATDAVIAGARGIEQARKAAGKLGVPDWPVVTLQVMRADLADQQIPAGLLCGLSEIAAILGVSRQRALQVSRQPTFPPPVAVVSRGAVWARSDVERYCARWPYRKPGHPPVVGNAKRARPEREPVTDEQLAEVAKVWAHADQGARTKAVAEHFATSWERAREMIAVVLERGLATAGDE